MKILILIVTLIALAISAGATDYTLTDLGRGEAFGINDLGQITGWRPDPNGGQMIAFVWDNANGFTDIGPATGRSINNKGQVAGYGWIWSKDTGLTNLPLPTGTDNVESACINESGQIAGYIHNSSGYRPIIWNTPSDYIVLNNPGWSWSINNNGRISGEWIPSPGEDHAYYWDLTSGFFDIGDFGTRIAAASSINDQNQIVGSYCPNDSTHAFLWSPDSGLLDLGTLVGPQGNSHANHINNEGYVVGNSMYIPASPVVHAFVWSRDTGMQDLGLLGGYNSGATNINSHNQICGVFRDSDNLEHIALWEPVPVVSSLTGTVTLQDFKGNVMAIRVSIELRKTGEPNVSNIIYLNATGGYTLNDIPKGQYDVAFKAGHWLGRTIHDVDLTNDVANLNVFLINGDADGDNGVDLSDYNIVKRANGSKAGHKKWNPDADLDGNGKVDKADLSIVWKNIGQVGDL